MSTRAVEFLEEQWERKRLLGPGEELVMTEGQLYWLRDLWAKFQ